MLAGFCSKLTSPFPTPESCFRSGHWMIAFDAAIGFRGIFRRKATDATTGFSSI
jgi:hypothetical protein